VKGGESGSSCLEPWTTETTNSEADASWPGRPQSVQLKRKWMNRMNCLQQR